MFGHIGQILAGCITCVTLKYLSIYLSISVAEAAAHGCLGRYARRLKLILRRFAVVEDGFFFISVEDDYFVFAFVKRLFLADYLLN